MKAAKPDLIVLWNKICLESDINAFEQLYRYLYSRLIRFSVYYVGDKQAAEDLVTEVFVKCWENRNSGTSILNPESYLFIAVKNQSLKYLKKNSSVTFIDLVDVDDDVSVTAQTPQYILETKELHKQLNLAIESLAPQSREVFRLIKEGGMKYKEVAEMLNISPRTVQTQLFRAIAKLRLILKPLGEMDSGENRSRRIISLLFLLGTLSFLYYL
ncbi:RNA polymerase sigma-70 factor (ECF subfamily) [Pedobacter psychrotolerans]|uniref:DNA-directed RNA polymerase sigma-70 factor n=1 Tax=Pedobacter psychrotolerans TaxID=1843235 RepID=A0A4R2H1J2_9SPHI|nr:RNA polymerase sigma-70 factor [Pedobacter psychrotolerans]TCO18208.1 RNA polymerase sigma-70 factor (ECF subfamily) [Pedobacter psychrotolerans]GGE70626.1 DNA-directed RNA polymerase sigma-70 factor [Pedobacter psychrotolerans]